MNIHDFVRRWKCRYLIGTEDEARVTVFLGAVSDNRRVDQSCAFFALPSTALQRKPTRLPVDRRSIFAKSAALAGAKLIVVGPNFDIPAMQLDAYQTSKIFIVSHPDPARVFAEYLALSQPLPTTIELAAITGTNGKTSVAGLVRDIWTALGYLPYSVGTLGFIGEKKGSSSLKDLTTPSAAVAHRISEQAATQLGASHIVFEASSQGLEEQRLSFAFFNAVGFTNLTQDHYDYHEFDQANHKIDLATAGERYFDAKMRLLIERTRNGAWVVLNGDDPEFKRIKTRAITARPDLKIVMFGNRKDADIGFERGHSSLERQEIWFTYQGIKRFVRLPLIGDFQAENAACAIGITMGCGADFEAAVAALEHATPVTGRMEHVGTMKNGGRIFVDYAHTPDALAKTLASARNDPFSGEISVLFGCGGKRDIRKRPKMGYAVRTAHRIYITDDNPRGEDAGLIRDHALEGCRDADVVLIKNIAGRRTAIHEAMRDLPKGGTLLICGKGHEDYQAVDADDNGENEVREPFSDRLVVIEAIEELDF